MATHSQMVVVRSEEKSLAARLGTGAKHSHDVVSRQLRSRDRGFQLHADSLEEETRRMRIGGV